MWQHVGIERVGQRLLESSHTVAFWARYTLDKIFDDRGGWELQNMLLTGGADHRVGAVAERKPWHSLPSRLRRS